MAVAYPLPLWQCASRTKKQYDLALAAIENDNYNEAIDILTGIIQYEDGKNLLEELQKLKYDTKE